MNTSPPPDRYKWELLFLLCGAFFFHQADRAIFGVVVSQIKRDLALNDGQVGLIATALFLTLALLMPFTGLVGDRFNRKWVITVALIFWSLATALTGATTGLIGLILLRSIATGGGEAFYAPSAYALLAQHHVETRSRAMGLHQAALYIGVMASGLLGGWIADHFGWRAAFYVFGGGGIVLGIVCIFRMRSAPAPVGEGAARVPPLASLLYLFRVRTAVLLTVGFTAIVTVNNGFVVWAPELLREKFSLNLTEAGGYSLFIHHLAALGGVIFGGWLTDRLVLNRATVRLEMQAAAMLLGAPAIALMGLAPSLWLTCVALALFGLWRGIYECNTHASLFDVIPPQLRGAATAMMTMCAFVIGSLSPWLLGLLRGAVGGGQGLSYGLASLALLYVVGGLALILARTTTFAADHARQKTETISE
jgi:MFS family permease